MSILYIQGKEFNVGIIWQVIDDFPPLNSVDARKIAGEYKCDLICKHTYGTKTIYGFGSSATGHNLKFPALGSLAAFAQLGSWCGAFEIESDQYLILASEDNIPHPFSDEIYNDIREAEERIKYFINEGYSEIYVPENWYKFEELDLKHKNLNDLLKHASDRWADGEIEIASFIEPPKALFEKIKSKSGLIKRVLLLLILSSLGFYIYTIYNNFENEKTTLENEKTRLKLEKEIQEEKERELQDQRFKNLKKNWENMNFPSDTISACLSNMFIMKNTIIGWKNGPASCKNNVISAEWVREDSGQLSWLKQWAGDQNIQVTINAKSSASLSKNINIKKTRGANAIGNEAPLNERLIQIAGLINSRLTLETSIRLTENTLFKTSANIFSKRFTFDGVEWPHQLGENLDLINGLNIDAISENGRGLFKLEGNFYYEN